MKGDLQPALPVPRGARRREELGLLALIAALLLVCVPVLSDVSLYHSDERYYTDAAIHMVRTGDWTTPWYLGEPRLKKPMLTYWLMAGSYEVLGIGLFASRLPSLLLGCLLAWLTWRTALAFFADRGIALVSAALLVSLWPLTALACRSTPDIAITVFTLMSLHGFARVLLSGEKGFGASACAWGGAGLAVASKGGLGVAAAAWALAFGLLQPQARARVKHLLHPLGLLLGAAAALAGFAWALFGPGKSSPGALLDDQVATKLARSLGEVGDNLGTYLACILRHFLPWTALVLFVWIRDRRVLRTFVRENQAAHAFGLGWSALVVLVFSLANAQRARYLAPAYPMIAIFCAAWLVQALRRGGSAALVRASWSAIFAAMAVAGLAAAVCGARIDARFAWGGLLLAAIAGGSWWTARKLSDVARLALGGGTLLAGAALAEVFFRSALDPSAMPQVAERLERQPGARCATLGLDHRYSAQILAITGGRVEATSLPEHASQADLDPYPVVVVPSRLADRLESAGYRLEPCGFEYARFRGRDVWDLIASPRPADVLARRKEPFYIALRPARG